MITDLPLYVYMTFAAALIYALIIFYLASNKSVKLLVCIVLWGILHSTLAISGFYKNTMTVPPRLLFLVFPIIFIIFSSIFSKKMKTWLQSLSLKWLTWLHVVRTPVEIVLYGLFVKKYVPEIMTFEGRNFDIIVGFTAPVIALLFLNRDRVLNGKIQLIWNIGATILLLNILVTATLSTPTVLQQFAFENPNIAIFNFPFILLPAMIVPLVLIAHASYFMKATSVGYNNKQVIEEMHK